MKHPLVALAVVHTLGTAVAREPAVSWSYLDYGVIRIGDLPHLVFECDDRLVKHAPVNLGENLKPEQVRYTGGWLAFVNDKNFGIGIRTPGTTTAVTYRHRGTGSAGPNGSACSYVAPIRRFPLTKGLVVDYDFHLTIGSLDEIPARFAKPGKK